MEITKEKIQIFYFKRWSGISARILRVLCTVEETSNEITRLYLEDYAESLQTTKNEEKKQTNIFKYE